MELFCFALWENCILEQSVDLPSGNDTQQIELQLCSDRCKTWYTKWSTLIRCQAVSWIRNAILSLYLGLTCFLYCLESLLKVKVCHVVYAANSYCSWAVLGIGDYINQTDMQCRNGFQSVFMCLLACGSSYGFSRSLTTEAEASPKTCTVGSLVLHYH